MLLPKTKYHTPDLVSRYQKNNTLKIKDPMKIVKSGISAVKAFLIYVSYVIRLPQTYS
jgi:hypothetical protein